MRRPRHFRNYQLLISFSEPWNLLVYGLKHQRLPSGQYRPDELDVARTETNWFGACRPFLAEEEYCYYSLSSLVLEIGWWRERYHPCFRLFDLGWGAYFVEVGRTGAYCRSSRLLPQLLHLERRLSSYSPIYRCWKLLGVHLLMIFGSLSTDFESSCCWMIHQSYLN